MEIRCQGHLEEGHPSANVETVLILTKSASDLSYVFGGGAGGKVCHSVVLTKSDLMTSNDISGPSDSIFEDSIKVKMDTEPEVNPNLSKDNEFLTDEHKELSDPIKTTLGHFVVIKEEPS